MHSTYLLELTDTHSVFLVSKSECKEENSNMSSESKWDSRPKTAQGGRIGWCVLFELIVRQRLMCLKA